MVYHNVWYTAPQHPAHTTSPPHLSSLAQAKLHLLLSDEAELRRRLQYYDWLDAFLRYQKDLLSQGTPPRPTPTIRPSEGRGPLPRIRWTSSPAAGTTLPSCRCECPTQPPPMIAPWSSQLQTEASPAPRPAPVFVEH